ncbi:MAG: short-chain dehydrogenase/reductase [Flavobacteriaceae bacterium TMED68]|nr:MAG: short-chain dehydrogenase/reductase [Flavobacteriaceae bacterium TMED68]
MNKVILITGASSGIGKNTALSLIKEGHVVYGAARRLEMMQDIIQAGGHAIKMDILKERNIDEVVNQIVKEQNRIDVLINNAGYGLWGAVETISIAEAKRQFDVNIFGLAYLTKKIIPLMRKQKSGKIVNMSSMGGKVYTPFGAWYHATKYALEGWSDCLRMELKNFGIDVILIEPGIIKTEFQDVMMDSTVERSIGTPYEKKLKALEKATQEMYAKGIGSPPSTITKLIIKAINSHNPKRRYVGGLFAKPMLFIKKWFGDKIYEKAIMSQIKKAKKE